MGAVCSRKSSSSVTASPCHLPPRVGKAEENPPAGDGPPRRCAPRNDGELGIDKRWKAGIMKVGGSPCLLTEVIVSWGTMGGYFFFIWIYLENQRNDADDQNAELNEIRIRDHLHHPPYVVEEERSCGLLKGNANEGPPAYRLPRRCAPRNDVELGIDFFPYHVILKIKRGAAGRRESLGITFRK